MSSTALFVLWKIGISVQNVSKCTLSKILVHVFELIVLQTVYIVSNLKLVLFVMTPRFLTPTSLARLSSYCLGTFVRSLIVYNVLLMVNVPCVCLAINLIKKATVEFNTVRL